MPWWTCAYCSDTFFTTHEEYAFRHCPACARCQSAFADRCPMPDGEYCHTCAEEAKRRMRQLADLIVPKGDP
jgi:hypothetical protein